MARRKGFITGRTRNSGCSGQRAAYTGSAKAGIMQKQWQRERKGGAGVRGKELCADYGWTAGRGIQGDAADRRTDAAAGAYAGRI